MGIGLVVGSLGNVLALSACQTPPPAAPGVDAKAEEEWAKQEPEPEDTPDGEAAKGGESTNDKDNKDATGNQDKKEPESDKSDKDEAKQDANPAEREAIAIVDRQFAWVDGTYSGVVASPGDPNLDPLLARCGPGDGALHDVASALAELAARQVELDPELLNYWLRKRGSPYVTPEVWSVEVAGPVGPEVDAAAQDWLSANRPRGPVRCGIGSAVSSSTQSIVMLRAQNPGQLLPIPMKVAPNTKQRVEVRLFDPPLGVELVALPPVGRARRATMSVSGELAQADVYLSDPGEWLLQVMVEASGGPKPVFLAAVQVGGEPKAFNERKAVPGEKAYRAELAPEAAIEAMLNQARKTAHLGPLKRSTTLDQIAQRHSENMARMGRISHDTGDGLPGRRIEAAGLSVAAAGENVALAPSVLRLHRALWASPSHRENMLLPRWEEVGIGVAKDASGRLFLTQLFVDR
jgi:uncharacterized protein YkwD